MRIGSIIIFHLIKLNKKPIAEWQGYYEIRYSKIMTEFIQVKQFFWYNVCTILYLSHTKNGPWVWKTHCTSLPDQQIWLQTSDTHRVWIMQIFKISLHATELSVNYQREWHIQDDIVVDGQTKHQTNQAELCICFPGFGVEPVGPCVFSICEHACHYHKNITVATHQVKIPGVKAKGGRSLPFINGLELATAPATIIDKICCHMPKKATFPWSTLNQSCLLWNKVSVAPLLPEQSCNKHFPSSTGNLKESELCALLQINIVQGRGGLCQQFCPRL